MDKTKTKRISIKNSSGLHARPAAKFVEVASRYVDCEVWVIKGDEETVNGKSIMGLLMLAAACGTELEIQVSGESAEVALNEICQLINNRFGME